MSLAENPFWSAQSLMAFGLPSIMAQALVPKLMSFISRYPKIARLLPYLLALLSAAGAIVYGIKPLYEKLLDSMWSWLPELEIQSTDPLYRYLNKYVNSKAVHTVQNKWLVSTRAKRKEEPHEFDDERSNAEEDKKSEGLSGLESDIVYDNLSSRLFYHKGTVFLMETPDPNDEYAQTLSIRAFAPSYKSLNALLKESWSTYRTKAMEETTEILEPEYSSWRTRKHKMIRKLNTIDIDEASKTKIINDVARYLSPATKHWYRRRGIPHRRGYLFHGPPGTGKSSLAAAIAGHFQVKLYSLSLTDKTIGDSYLLSLMNAVEEGSVILLEDVDSSGIHRENPDEVISTRSNITLSGLLNALDGASAPEGHILIMSTNTPESLDAALVRAGRVDCEIEFKNASRTSAANIFIRMMSDDEDDEKNKDIEEKAQQFAQQIPEETLSPAEIQGFLLDHARDTEGALKGVSAWVEEIAAKQASIKEAAEAARLAKDGEKEEKKKEVELLKRKNELEEQALEKREAAAAKLEEMEQKTRQMTLEAEKLRAEAEITKFQKRRGKLSNEQLAPEASLTPADSDNEQYTFDKAREADKAEKVQTELADNIHIIDDHN